MSDARLIYLPLGGAGEIGMNMYLYGYGPEGEEEWIIVDTGITFPDMETTPGVDVIMADIDFIQARADRLLGIFITHAHEDHVGALGHLFPKLLAPVYCRKFTGYVARNKMERTGQDPEQVNVVGAWPHQVKLGPFQVGFMPIAHSIPETSALVIDTPAGRVMHTADFKADKSPGVGEPFDPDLIRSIAGDGLQALVCDSTNVFSPAPGRSEADIIGPIRDVMREARGLVVATTFASNIARLRTLAQAATDAGRSVVVLGRAMNFMLEAGHSTGVLDSFPPVVPVEDMHDIPRENLLVLATGSQGERRAASAQLARDSYMGLELKEGDTFLFSSKTIPGNEVSVGRILNQLSEKGVTVIDDSSDRYHVSGHANRPDILQMHDLTNPKIVVPMHGEHRHLSAQAKLATEQGRTAVVAPNGTMVDIGGDAPEIIGYVEAGRTYLDGNQLIGALDGVVRDRIRMALRGTVTVSLILESDGRPVDGAWVESLGIADASHIDGGLDGALEREIDSDLEEANRKTLLSDEALELLVTRACNRICKALAGKKPLVSVMINRLELD
ncbi:ribonuclease J [Oceanomicrobium pacificus]|uniref:MBL fold metallo-hydrolase n=1 Tax=Oceanomicrobium pacificus TaxID=2692916 RepID=A0A6B0TV19_9RHOB|nr:ribonuclease J [Oceanomicrobium pacificus]MXU65615.1 MBL fold metallo-hydrolase [Oceanomicrobium pacificus]